MNDSETPNEERVELSPKPELKENGKLEDDAAKLHPKPAQEHCESKDSNDERSHFPNPAQEQTDSDNFKEKISNYFFKSEVQALHKAISDSAQHIDKSSSTADYLSEVKDLLLKRLPSIAANLKKLAEFASLLGPAGAALGLAVDLVAAFGLMTDTDPVTSKLDAISKQIDGLHSDMLSGFDALQTRLEANRVLADFTHILNKIKSQVEIFEENVQKTILLACTNTLRIWLNTTH